MAVALGYHIERFVLVLVYSLITLIACAQSVGSDIAHIEFRLVLGIYDVEVLTLPQFIVNQIIAVGVILQLKRFAGLGEEEELRIITSKELAFQYIIVLFLNFNSIEVISGQNPVFCFFWIRLASSLVSQEDS
jgi:hypothetical protein